MIDLTSVESSLLQALGIVLLAILIAAGKRALTWLGVKLTADQQAELEDVADKSLTAALTRLGDQIKMKGWDHVDVRDAAVKGAIDYAIEKFPDALKRAGIDTSSHVMAAAKLADMLERRFPETAAKAAASPVTPPVPSPAPRS